MLALNLGDSYANANGGTSGGQGATSQRRGRSNVEEQVRAPRPPGLKPKDLMMIPARVALALQADGWWLRSDIIWAKGLSGEATRDPDAWCGSVMPESVTDRPTQAHEHIFLLAKSERYFYDHYAVREPSSPDMQRRAAAGHTRGGRGKLDDSRNDHGTFRGEEQKSITGGGRNLRNVLTVSPRGFKGAHFAVFPVELPLMLLPAICPSRVCAACGVAWERRVERISEGRSYATAKSGAKRDAGLVTAFSGYDDGSSSPTIRDLGFFPACGCGAERPIPQEELDADPTLLDDFEIEPPEPVPGIVLDPFLGSGTTVAAAQKLSRRSVGIELNPEYESVIRERLDIPEGGTLFDDAGLGFEFTSLADCVLSGGQREKDIPDSQCDHSENHDRGGE